MRTASPSCFWRRHAVTNGRRMSNVGSGLHDKCAQAIAKWDQLEDPVDIEDAVHAFIPQRSPCAQRSSRPWARC